ncbi:unnamed protein product [Lactuca saligna]|uniref:F-box domain-containing protein n=1 Tax=Lactuca saligna TaxID=75948 RepID=A0AA35ZX92_LACSI|nr:unnamed protein product [Lactuca saligna]
MDTLPLLHGPSMAKRPCCSDPSIAKTQSTMLPESDNDAVLKSFLAGKRSDRKRSSSHNAVVWPLPPDLMIKVFAMLDTQSVCYAAATCSFFQKCVADPLCFSNIDLITLVPKVNNAVVSSMIRRAGNALQSMKLGVLPPCTPPLFCSSEPLVYSIRNSTDASGASWNDKQ